MNVVIWSPVTRSEAEAPLHMSYWRDFELGVGNADPVMSHCSSVNLILFLFYFPAAKSLDVLLQLLRCC